MPESYDPRGILEALADEITDAFLERQPEVSVPEVAAVAVEKILALPDAERMRALVEAVLGAVGARMERRTNTGRDLANVSVPGEGRVARWSPAAERLALERRRAREPGGPLDA